MTQTLKKQNFESGDLVSYYNKYYKAQNTLRPIVLNYLFRDITFLTKRERIRALTTSEYREISKAIDIPEILIHKFISEFLIGLLRLKKFLRYNPSILHSKTHNQTVSIFLFRIHRLAPIFDYRRAKENAKRLHTKLNTLFFWPQVMTQIAVVIFITDLLDKFEAQRIIQTNLRALCSCSAYAFHRTRNKIGLTTKYIKNL